MKDTAELYGFRGRLGLCFCKYVKHPYDTDNREKETYKKHIFRLCNYLIFESRYEDQIIA